MENSKVNQSLDSFLNVLREEILAERLDMVVVPETNPGIRNFYADVYFYVNGIAISISVGKNIICYHNGLIDGFLDKDISKLDEIVKRRIKIPNEKIEEIRLLKQKIKEIEESFSAWAN